MTKQADDFFQLVQVGTILDDMELYYTHNPEGVKEFVRDKLMRELAVELLKVATVTTYRAQDGFHTAIHARVRIMSDEQYRELKKVLPNA